MKHTKTVIIGGTGFIGTNLVQHLGNQKDNNIIVTDVDSRYFETIRSWEKENISFVQAAFSSNTDFDSITAGADTVYHLASSTYPGNSNINIPQELENDVITTAKLLDACVRQHVKKLVFISSGGAVYGKKGTCPINEEMVTYPITSYGIQKVAIEKLLYLYRYQKGLDYRVIRLGNPYGPYQRPDGRLGVVTTFVYKALQGQVLDVYGDGTVVRDFIFIDDAIQGIMNITNGESEYRTFNLGSGKGTSVNEIIHAVRATIKTNSEVRYHEIRNIDVPVNYLDMTRYNTEFGQINYHTLEQGIRHTADYLIKAFHLNEAKFA